MSELPDFNRLRWQCRRGMLELDYLLQSFLDDHFELLELKDQQLFIELLGESDEDLFSWLMNSKEEFPERYRSLLAVIKNPSDRSRVG